jgi:hypothetical protein
LGHSIFGGGICQATSRSDGKLFRDLNQYLQGSFSLSILLEFTCLSFLIFNSLVFDLVGDFDFPFIFYFVSFEINKKQKGDHHEKELETSQSLTGLHRCDCFLGKSNHTVLRS